ncbi:Panacea domain-containing protein [Evansella sp. AB-P1]|uniref:Panacea domain-containing protein n=1 Tax=Evansella sp. AB-P1 TaxID=3037653 RepID=UPI00241C1B70|nr:Panacea domain-containing protein [Evansella sp. AB-P1]MDG5789778.1 Panacea domain-containing protein [Evansella sp. AB-P1]
MAKIKDVIYYFLINYPYKEELSKTRLTKLVYLADWENSLRHGEQITKIKWFFDHYGPFVPDVYETAIKDKKLSIITGYTPFGRPKVSIGLTEKNGNVATNISLNDNQKAILDKIIEDTKYLNWNDFINHVYSTYPITSQKRYNQLNLVQLAKETNCNY